MSFEIRTLTSDEIPAASLLSAQAFGSSARHDITAQVEHARANYDPDWYLGVFEGNEMTSMMRILPEHMWLNGAALSFGAVSPVANSPLHRRRGYSGAMMRRSLELMRERGQVLSGLYTPHPAFYRRYGWEIASEWREYQFAPKDLRLQARPKQRGSFRFLPVGDWQMLKAVYDRFAPSGNGTFQRADYWWKTRVADSPWLAGTDVVVWQNDAGTDEGYALYQQPTRPGPYELVSIRARELVGFSPDAYLNLWEYFGRHDIHEEVSIAASPYEALMPAVADTERLQIKQGFAVLLRVVDFEAAMRQRVPAANAEGAGLTLRLIDESAPWNDGTWSVSIDGAQTDVRRSTGEPDLTLPANVLAALFNGYLTPRSAQAAGLLEATSSDAIASAAQVFAVTAPPYFIDHF